MSVKEFQRHIVLYAKGHYLNGWSIIKDLQIIAENTEIETNLKVIINELAHVALTAIREAHDGVNPFHEYREQMYFLMDSRELVKKYGPGPLDKEEQFEIKLNQLYQESVAASMLVIIARWMTELDLGDPDPKILSVRSPKKEKKDD